MKSTFKKVLGLGVAVGLVSGFAAVTGKDALAWEPEKACAVRCYGR